jgi:hypothetical protein
MISRYGSHALAAGARPGGGLAAAESVDTPSALAGFTGAESVDTPSVLASFAGVESMDTPPALAGFAASTTCRGARTAMPAPRRYAPAVSRRIPVASSIFRSDQPSRPSASTCCFFSSLKTLAIPAGGPRPLRLVNVPAPSLHLAGFEGSITGRFWVSTEAPRSERTTTGRALPPGAPCSTVGFAPRRGRNHAARSREW